MRRDELIPRKRKIKEIQSIFHLTTLLEEHCCCTKNILQLMFFLEIENSTKRIKDNKQ